MSFCGNSEYWQKTSCDAQEGRQNGPLQNSLIAEFPVELACRILEFCEWRTRGATMRLNRHWLRLFQDDSVWRTMCTYLHSDNFVYCPPVIPFATWKECFTQLWPVRKRWKGESKMEEAMTFSINVVARFRPLPPEGKTAAAVAKEEIVLPLHQQLAILQQAGLTPAQARTQLFGTRPDFFASAMLADDGSPLVAAPPSPAAEEPPIEYAPLNKTAEEDVDSDETEGSEDVSQRKAKLQGRELGVVSVMPNAAVMCAPGVGIRRFDCFDRVFDAASTQAMVYEKAARREVFEFINGLNCTIMLYGQTGSGKTFTLFGEDSESSTSLRITQASGIVPRVCAEVMEAIETRTALGVECVLHVSYVEVYGDEVTDLIKGGVSTGHWAGTAARAVIEGTASQQVHDASELQRLLRFGEFNKRKAATKMNERSSRAHALLFLSLDQTVQLNRKKVNVKSTMCLADLGGCEQLKKSGAKGERLKEAIHINMGLLALKQCITRLNKHTRAAVIPYNDSRLTQLLRSALGGDSKTTVVVTCSMESSNVMETIHALRFGEKCAVVQNIGGNKVNTIADQIAELDAEIGKTRAEIIRKEQWTNAPAENKASFELEGVATVKSALVGAEAEGERLAKLLEWRAQLLGTNNILDKIKVRKQKPFKPAEWKE